MAEQPVPTKAELVAALSDGGAALVERLRAVPEDAFAYGVYENGWNGRQVLAHVAAIEWTYPRLLEIARQARSAPPNLDGQPPTRTAQGGIDAYNKREVEKRAAASIAELIAEFERNRATTIAAIAGADEALLATPIRSAGGVTGPLARVFQSVAVDHVRGHVDDILSAT